jgi:hypothetical protein
MTRRDRVVLIDEVATLVRIDVAAVRTFVDEGRRDVRLLREKIVRRSIGGDF